MRDPIQELINWQLGSTWPDQAHKVSNSKRGSRKWNLRSHKEYTTKINLMEDLMIEALDRKYHMQEKVMDRIGTLAEQGYFPEDIASMTGFSKRTIFRVLNRMRKTWEK